MRKVIVAAVIAAFVAGCVTDSDVISFQPKSYQQAIMREGDQTISSRGKYSTVSVRSATHLVGDQPIFIVGIENVSQIPLDFRVEDVTAGQIVDGTTNPLKVYTYDELVAKEQTAQVGRALLASVLSGVNSGLAGNNDYNQAVADQQNQQFVAAVSMKGQQNIAELEQLAIKDTTVMPGESYAGKLYLQPPASSSGPKLYSFNIKVGPDHHEFQVIQSAAVR